MKRLKIQCGVECYRLGDFGVVRFDPADPSLFRRLLSANEKVEALEQTVRKELESAGGGPADMLEILDRADKRIKELLGWVFGPANDFGEIFRGVNLLTPGADGQPLLSQVMAALTAPVKAGVARWTDRQVAQAREKAVQRRAQQ